MLNKKKLAISLIIILVNLFCLLLSGCSSLAPHNKVEIGPAGKPTESKPNPPFFQRFANAPSYLYNLEAIAGVIFEGINSKDWTQTSAGFLNLKTTWIEVKPLIGEKKGVKEADSAISELEASIQTNNGDQSYQNLIKFMGNISDIGKSYKLSPISDIVVIGNAVREVAYYVEDKDWKKASAKVKGLEGSWHHVKPGIEKVGILGEVTKTHSTIQQIKDAVDSESKSAVLDHIKNINESIGRIRDYYYGT